MSLYTLDLEPYDPYADKGIFDTTNAIDVENPPPITFKQLMRSLYMIEYLIDLFDQLSLQEIEQAQYFNVILCEFINSNTKDNPERVRLIEQLRSLEASLFGKPGAAAVFYKIFPSVHELHSGHDMREKPRDDRMRGPQGW